MRTELYTEGVDVGRLGSYRDRTLRSFLEKRKVKESRELMAILTSNSGNGEEVQKHYRDYVHSTWYRNLTEDRNDKLVKYYEENVRHFRPNIIKREDGSTVLGGLKK